MTDPATFAWHTRTGGACAPSPPALASLDAARRARNSNDVLPRDLVLTTRNAAGPAFLSSEEMTPALGGIIANARHEVDLQWHVIDADSDAFHNVIGGIGRLYGKLVMDQARGKSRENPVIVRIVSPDFGGRPGNNVQKLASAIRARLGEMDPSLLRLEVAAHKYWGLATMHVKMAVVDGVIVHAGGGNLSNHQNYHDGVVHERDSAYVVKGDVGRAALAQFDDLWNHSATTVYGCDTSRCSKIERRGPAFHAPEVVAPDLASYGVESNACLPMIFLARRATENIFSSEIDNPIGQGILGAFGASTKMIKISSPNLNGQWVKPVYSAVLSGKTKVQVMLPQIFNETVEAVPFFGTGTNRKTMSWFMKNVGPESIGPGKIFDGRWFSIDGRTIQQGGWDKGGRHIKYYSVDDQLAIIGSTNLDKQSMSRSREIAIVVDDATVTKAWDAKIFDADFQKAIPINGAPLPEAPETPDESMEQASEGEQAEYVENL